MGKSAAIQSLLSMVERVAEADATVLITGESGTGKELVARALHEESPRHDAPFVPINCGAIASSLLESELFGHIKGAFTGAQRRRAGVFERAEGGTVFLDEVGEMPADMQAALLRVLQERMVRPVGANDSIAVDVRVVAATNVDLREAVASGAFRQDLYYRLDVVRLETPALRDRGRDVLLLANHFVARTAWELGRDPLPLSRRVRARFLEYPWPGNVRELENAMERALILARTDEITLRDLPRMLREHAAEQASRPHARAEEMLSLAELEERHIRRVLRATEGNKARAARVLGVDRRTLYRKLSRLDA